LKTVQRIGWVVDAELGYQKVEKEENGDDVR